MDKPTSKNEITPEPSNSENSRFNRRGPRVALFLGTYMAAVMVTIIILAIRDSLYGEVLPIILLFPSGLILLTERLGGGRIDYLPPWTVLGYFIYSVILVAGTRVKSRRNFFVFYIIFIILLLWNIAGCTLELGA